MPKKTGKSVKLENSAYTYQPPLHLRMWAPMTYRVYKQKILTGTYHCF